MNTTYLKIQWHKSEDFNGGEKDGRSGLLSSPQIGGSHARVWCPLEVLV